MNLNEPRKAYCRQMAQDSALYRTLFEVRLTKQHKTLKRLITTSVLLFGCCMVGLLTKPNSGVFFVSVQAVPLVIIWSWAAAMKWPLTARYSEAAIKEYTALTGLFTNLATTENPEERLLSAAYSRFRQQVGKDVYQDVEPEEIGALNLGFPA